MENLAQKWTQSGPIFLKISTFSDFQKRAGETFPQVSCQFQD